MTAGTRSRREIFHDIARHDSSTPYLVSAWQHLCGHEYGAEEFSQAYIDFVNRWDWDWVKINPRAVYCAEIWGSRYDHDPENYLWHMLPRKVSSAIDSPSDVSLIVEQDPRENDVLVEELEASTRIRSAFEDRAVLQTVFSPLSILLSLADVPLYPHDTYSTPNVTLDELVFDQPDAAKAALGAIARTLVEYVRLLVRPQSEGGAGLDGVFYAVTGTASEGYFSREQYREFGEPFDRLVLDAIHDENPQAVVLLHTCRADSHPEWFDVDGVDFLHWDQYQPGNPKADADLKAVPVAGPNWPLFIEGGDASQIREQLEQTIRLREGRPFLLAPSCTIPTPAGAEQLDALGSVKLA